jgi:histidyl-tRNA synthetase
LWFDRSGREIEGQMWTFRDKGQRDCCLIPEATALVQREYRERWSKEKAKPVRVFYVQRCYRYERPQAGRYREFTQFGVEMLGPNPEAYEKECTEVLMRALFASELEGYDVNTDAVRGLSYYSRNGFEVSVDRLGAQKQIAGGGVYAEGCGWAIGVDRLVLALSQP